MNCLARFKVVLTTYLRTRRKILVGNGQTLGRWTTTYLGTAQELINAKYYLRDVKRAKEQKFLSLKQEEMSVLEYVAKFNELSRFAPNQVATEEMKVDHFEQGLKGSIKSMIVGHSFDSYQEKYHRAVKIARVLDETQRENKASGLRKRKFEYDNKGQKGGNPERFNSSRP